MRNDAELLIKEKKTFMVYKTGAILTNRNRIKDFILNCANNYVPCKATYSKKHILWVNRSIQKKII